MAAFSENSSKICAIARSVVFFLGTFVLPLFYDFFDTPDFLSCQKTLFTVQSRISRRPPFMMDLSGQSTLFPISHIEMCHISVQNLDLL